MQMLNEAVCISLGKVINPSLAVDNNRTDLVLYSDLGNQTRRRKTLSSNQLQFA